MPGNIIPLILKNTVRSKTRVLATVGGCAIGAFVICFFMAAGHSLEKMKQESEGSSNLIVTQQDRF